eukprot:CAMPEP_0115045026 /NCGR_PEP_ID=MMETSP0216-20121206/47886_1 /TAXON_ID=223996 /ORGANISM="Protocruzia adherens, Strain Boccale" /LENGTH=639 /DNA_ID=CAMNT_0002427793 /DNA_START=73 /DNA_END=1992 /DNA_ORIENTATION=+
MRSPFRDDISGGYASPERKGSGSIPDYDEVKETINVKFIGNLINCNSLTNALPMRVPKFQAVARSRVASAFNSLNNSVASDISHYSAMSLQGGSKFSPVRRKPQKKSFFKKYIYPFQEFQPKLLNIITEDDADLNSSFTNSMARMRAATSRPNMRLLTPQSNIHSRGWEENSFNGPSSAMAQGGHPTFDFEKLNAPQSRTRTSLGSTRTQSDSFYSNFSQGSRRDENGRCGSLNQENLHQHTYGSHLKRNVESEPQFEFMNTEQSMISDRGSGNSRSRSLRRSETSYSDARLMFQDSRALFKRNKSSRKLTRSMQSDEDTPTAGPHTRAYVQTVVSQGMKNKKFDTRLLDKLKTSQLEPRSSRRRVHSQLRRAVTDHSMSGEDSEDNLSIDAPQLELFPHSKTEIEQDDLVTLNLQNLDCDDPTENSKSKSDPTKVRKESFEEIVSKAEPLPRKFFNYFITYANLRNRIESKTTHKVFKRCSFSKVITRKELTTVSKTTQKCLLSLDSVTDSDIIIVSFRGDDRNDYQLLAIDILKKEISIFVAPRFYSNSTLKDDLQRVLRQVNLEFSSENAGIKLNFSKYAIKLYDKFPKKLEKNDLVYFVLYCAFAISGIQRIGRSEFSLEGFKAQLSKTFVRNAF